MPDHDVYFTIRFSGRDIVTVLDTLNFLPMQKVLTATKFMRLRGGLYKIAEGKGEFVNASPIDIGTDNIIPPILREVSKKDVIILSSGAHFLQRHVRLICRMTWYPNSSDGRKQCRLSLLQCLNFTRNS